MRQGSHFYPTCATSALVFAVLVLCAAPNTGVCTKAEVWPQFGNIAPLPGAGMAVDADGNSDGLGALQINVPVAYNPRWGYLLFSAYAGNYTNVHNEDFGNGSGVFGMTFGARPRLYISAMQVSREIGEAKVLSCQVMLTEETPDRPAIAVGVQDILKKEPNGRSPYAVLTKSLTLSDTQLYATLGYGGGRFLESVFGGLSVPLGGHFNLAAEWDGFQFNTGLAWRPRGRDGKITFLGGYNGKAGWLLGLGTTLDLRSPK